MERDGRQDKIITVIGGGPSGMAAAISAARQGAGAARVRLIEKNGILGRKLLATGNGRCNLTNTNCPDLETTLLFFKSLGLLIRTEEEGRAYPRSEQAVSVQEALIRELMRLQAEILCGRTVQAIEKAGSGTGSGADSGACAGEDFGFRITADNGTFYSDAVILATGGKAGPQYGSTGDGYRFAKAFGHSVVSVRPSLVQMVSNEAFFKQLKGVRAKGQVELLRENRAEEHGPDAGSVRTAGIETVVDREYGEIQFTEDGLSGICIFNLSKNYARGDIISIDLFPEYSEESLTKILTDIAGTSGIRSMAEFFAGMLHKKLIPALLAVLPLEEGRKAASLSREDIERTARFLKGWRIPITGTKGWKEAQVTAGGVDLTEIDPDTMESRLVPGLYFTGELLNMDGKCGGYNLQWAWSSGLAAGKAAARRFSF
jgi:hypothetical protein